MFFLLIVITLSPHNKYETIYENYVNKSHKDLRQIQIIRIELKSVDFS